MKEMRADMAGGVSLPPKPRGLAGLLRWAWASWATRSLAVGAVATAIDVLVLLACVSLFRMPNPVAAMIGVLFGSTFTFFANKYFAFRDANPGMAPQAAKFVLATAVGMLAHAQFIYLFADKLGVHVVLAKFAADILVFTVGQMLVLRYFIFPKKQPASVDESDRDGEAVAVPPERRAEIGVR